MHVFIPEWINEGPLNQRTDLPIFRQRLQEVERQSSCSYTLFQKKKKRMFVDPQKHDWLGVQIRIANFARQKKGLPVAPREPDEFCFMFSFFIRYSVKKKGFTFSIFLWISELIRDFLFNFFA